MSVSGDKNVFPIPVVLYILSRPKRYRNVCLSTVTTLEDLFKNGLPNFKTVSEA